MKDLFRLDGKIALVTGGAGLIGRALVEGLASFGAHVYIADFNLEIAEKYATELRGRGLSVAAILLDIRDPASISACVAKVVALSGTIDVWVNSAYPKTPDWGLPFEKVSPEAWRGAVDGQLNGYCFCCREAAIAMRPFRKGSVINLGSTYGIVGPDFSIYDGTALTMPAAYAAIKGGIINFTRYLASYYGKDGIRFNCISPGGIENNQPETFIRNYVNRTLLGRMASPQDIVGATVFLASDASAYVTGHNLAVDGGWTAI
ncbi:MAG TPA: SDR family oxidoreductase [Lacunisphaera sp.]|jgi:NAD(P)-dependent dehydrogenase (short-subunit alcohol dehydrogenase family)